jgi:O-antigen/teichoic acid export membrane protein
MKQSQRIVKNAVLGIAASVIGGAVYLATVLIIAHQVSVVEFGKYSFVLAFAMFFQLVADAGLPRMMIREIVKNPENVAHMVGASAALIWVLSLAVCLIVAALVPFLHYGTDVKVAALIMSFATLATFHGAGYSAVLRAFEDNELNYIGFILQKILLLIFILVAIYLKTGLVGFVVAHLTANLLLWNFYHIVVSKFYARSKLVIDLPLWKALLLSALPMGGGVMLRQLALQLDILILTWMTNMTTVGLFSGPYRLSMALRTFPQTLSLPLYPLFSRTAHLSPERFGEAYRQSLKFFALISIPFAAFFVAWAQPILLLALGKKFLPALPAMQLLGLGLFPFFMSTLFQYVFAALDEQAKFLASTTIGSTVRIVLLVTLIPKFGFVGPSIAFVCGETVVVGIWIFQISKLGHPARLASLMWRPLAAGAAMAMVLYAVRESPLLWQIGGASLSLLVYGLGLFLLRTFSSDEIQQAREGIAFVSPFIASWAKKLRRDS